MQIVAEGNDAAGAPFQRMLTLSTWAGLRIDAGTTGVAQAEIKSHPSGLTAFRVTVRPFILARTVMTSMTHPIFHPVPAARTGRP